MGRREAKIKKYGRALSGVLVLALVLTLLIPGISGASAESTGMTSDDIAQYIEHADDAAEENEATDGNITSGNDGEEKSNGIDEDDSEAIEAVNEDTDDESADPEYINGGDDLGNDSSVESANDGDDDDADGEDANTDSADGEDSKSEDSQSEDTNDEDTDGENISGEVIPNENTNNSGTGSDASAVENTTEEAWQALPGDVHGESEDEAAPEPGEDADEESIPEPEDLGSGSISGFFWIDGNGDLDTDWDGLYNGDEQPLTGFRLFLYAADNLNTALAITITDFDGNYSFNHLAPGSYVLGLWGASVAGIEYLAPVFVTDDNKFAIEWSISGLPAYTEAIELTDGQDIRGVNAGMRLPMGISPMRGWNSISGLNDSTVKSGDYLTIDNRTWVVVRTKQVQTDTGPIKAVYLLLKGSSYNYLKFGGSTNYATSDLRNRMTQFYTETSPSVAIPTIRAIALVPDLGILSSQTATTEPTGEMAGNRTEDILFAPSYKDMKDWTGSEDHFTSTHQLGSNPPGGGSFPVRFWFRTPSTYSTVEMIGYNRKYMGFDHGIHINSNTEIWDVPGVWVNANLTSRNVTIHYIDTFGNELHAPYTDPMAVSIDQAYPTTWHSAVEILDIGGYEYIEWRKGINGASQDKYVSPNLAVADVLAGTDLYLVYKGTTTEVTVTKTVTGGFISRSSEFTFTAYFTDGDENPLPAGTTFNYSGDVLPGSKATAPSNGVLTLNQEGWDTFTLKHGQSITIKGVPVDAKVRIVESSYNLYNTSYIDDDYPGSKEPNNMPLISVGSDGKIFSFENERKVVVPTGIESETWAIVALPLIATAFILTGMTALRILKRRMSLD